MLANTKIVLEDIVWEDGFIGPKTTWVKMPERYLKDAYDRDAYIRGFLAGVYGGVVLSYEIRQGYITQEGDSNA